MVQPRLHHRLTSSLRSRHLANPPLLVYTGLFLKPEHVASTHIFLLPSALQASHYTRWPFPHLFPHSKVSLFSRSITCFSCIVCISSQSLFNRHTACLLSHLVITLLLSFTLSKNQYKHQTVFFPFSLALFSTFLSHLTCPVYIVGYKICVR